MLASVLPVVPDASWSTEPIPFPVSVRIRLAPASVEALPSHFERQQPLGAARLCILVGSPCPSGSAAASSGSWWASQLIAVLRSAHQRCIKFTSRVLQLVKLTSVLAFLCALSCVELFGQANDSRQMQLRLAIIKTKRTDRLVEQYSRNKKNGSMDSAN